MMFLLGLCRSFGVGQQDQSLNDAESRANILRQIAGLLETKYVLSDLAPKYAAEFAKRCEHGAYDNYSNPKEFAEKVTEDLVEITHDRHTNFRLIESSGIGEKPTSSLHHPLRYHQLILKENCGFSKLEWIDGNIGYLDIRRFNVFPDVRDRVIGAMRFLENADAIIVDLRENGGGSGDYLSSYFLKHPTQLTSWYSREDDFLSEFWTSKDIGMEPLTDVPLFVLTSDRTFSASESFAYDMKVRGRATIVGEPTKGGAHSVDLYRIDGRFEIYLSTARAINPVTGGNWEGVGVVPDVRVPAAAALETAVELARRAAAEYAKKREARLKPAVETMQVQMDRAESLFRENNVADATAALDAVFRLAEDFHLLNEFFMDVLAYNFRSREDEQILYAILKRKIDDFPESPTAHESLAAAYARNDRKELAIAQYEKVLKLDPDNRNASKMIKRLRRTGASNSRTKRIRERSSPGARRSLPPR
jgi:tetratricopeptide (TPR) repeat protein